MPAGMSRALTAKCCSSGQLQQQGSVSAATTCGGLFSLPWRVMTEGMLLKISLSVKHCASPVKCCC